MQLLTSCLVWYWRDEPIETITEGIAALEITLQLWNALNRIKALLEILKKKYESSAWS